MKQNKRASLQALCLERASLCLGVLLLALFFATELICHLSPTRRINVTSRMLHLLLICILLYLFALLYQRRTQKSRQVRGVFCLFFALYCYLILSFTLMDETLGRGADSIYQILSQGARDTYNAYFVNLIPFHSIYHVYIIGYLKGYVNASYTLLNLLGNLAALMPLSFFLPLFFKRQKKWYVFFATVLLIGLLIELLQFLFMVGSCDVDDLILNVGGAILMLGILRIPIIKRLIQRFTLHAWQ